MLSFEEFWHDAAAALALPAVAVGRDTELQRDLGFDSLSMLELIAFLDELDAPVPEGLLASVITADDAYDLYRNHVCVTTAERAS